MKLKFVSHAIASLAIGAAIVASANVSACEVKIGLIGVLSGPGADWGASALEGTRFAAESINRAGGVSVNGQKCTITIVPADSKYSTEASAAAANELVSQGILIAVGPVGSNELAGVKPIAVRNHMLLMSDSYAKNVLSPKTPLIFHVGPGPSGWADPIIKTAMKRFKIAKVVVTAPNDEGGTDTGSVDGAMYKRNGATVSEEYYKRGTTNFAPLVLRILASNPDTVELASTPASDAGVIIKQLRQAGFKGVFGRLGGPSTEEIARVAGGYDVLQNFFWFEPILMSDKITAADARYRQWFGKAPPPTNYHQWEASARLVMLAINKANSIEPAKVAAALRTLPVSDPDMGDGRWIGKDFFGINQEVSLPFGMGVIANGKNLGIQGFPAATGK